MKARKKLFSEIPYLRKGRITLRKITHDDAPGLRELTGNPEVYRYLPTFLFEKRYSDADCVIDRLYDECLDESSMILGIYTDEGFCGIEEFYGYKEHIHQVSVGSRLLERCWGKGIAGEALTVAVDYLLNETDIEIITASSMTANRASGGVLLKNGFTLVNSGVPEDWGYDEPVLTDKWIR